MAVSFLTAAQRDRYGRYPDVVTPNDLSRCFHLSDDDRAQIMSCRGHHNRLGFALQLSTVRYLGTFLDDPIAVPSSVLQSLSHQLAIHTLDGLQSYRKGEQREEHVTKIRKRYGYGDITEPRVGFRMTRWLYGVCWTGTERLGALFDRATAWLLAHKILLPGVTTLERFVVSVRARVEARLYQLLTRGITVQQKDQLQRLLLVPEGGRVSLLDRIRSGEAAKAITSSNDPKIKLLREVNPSSSALIGPKLLTKLVRLHLILTGENDSDEILTQV